MKGMKIIAFANHKGGVAKTTSVATLGTVLAKAGYRILLVDLDSQCSLTESLIDFEPEETAYNAFLTGKFKNIIHVADNLDLIPAAVEISELDMMLAAKIAHEKILLKILKNIDAGEKYDIVMLDCSPSLGLITMNALVACNELYVPTTAEFLPLKGLKKLEAKCEELAEEANPGLTFTGIIVTRYDSRKNLHQSVDEALRTRYGDIVFRSRIRENVKISEAPRNCKDIVSYAPESNGAYDYVQLAKEMIDRFENE